MSLSWNIGNGWRIIGISRVVYFDVMEQNITVLLNTVKPNLHIDELSISYKKEKFTNAVFKINYIINLIIF